MKKKILVIISCISLIGIAICFYSTGIMLSKITHWFFTSETNAEIFEGISYIREVRNTPRELVIHIVTINLKINGLEFLVTPGKPDQEYPLKARTTAQFLDEFNLNLAVNGDGFTPWKSNGPLDYYPHRGDPVTPTGLASSRGVLYSQNKNNQPVLYISQNNKAQFNSPIGKIYNAISGNTMLVKGGKLAAEILNASTNDASLPNPRTSIGLDQHGKKLIIVVVDGRQPGYSLGVTLTELAMLLQEFGAYNAMNLDGGGSSTLVITNKNGDITLMNSPIDNNIPGHERPIANHLGVSIKH